MDEKLKRYPVADNMRAVEVVKMRVQEDKEEVDCIIVEVDAPPEADIPRKVPGIAAFIEKCKPFFEEDGIGAVVFRRKKLIHSTEVTP
jgi:hypothetical protein